MEQLEDMINISKVNAGKLRQAGIMTPDDLRKMGAKQALLWVRQKSDGGACLSMLQGLEGAIQGVRWHDLSDDVKADLKDFYNAL